MLSGGGGESTVRAWYKRPKLIPTNVELKVNFLLSIFSSHLAGSATIIFADKHLPRGDPTSNHVLMKFSYMSSFAYESQGIIWSPIKPQKFI